MPRTTARSSRPSTHGARRSSSARHRTARGRRTARPRLDPRQVREITAVLLILVGLLGLLAAASNPGSILDGIHSWLLGSFGHSWFVPDALAFGVGAYLLWPSAPRPRPLDLVTGLIAVLSLIGLFGMAQHAGGGLGDGIDRALIEVASWWGAAPALRGLAEPEDDQPEIEWKLPSIALLDTVTARRERMADEIKRNVKVIESTLGTFGVEAKVVGVNPGPAVTQFEVQPGPGVQVKRITALQNDLSLALAAAPLRIEAPIPGKSAVGIEVPNKSASLVTIREVLETAAFREGTNKLALGLGNDVSGQSIVADLTRMPHLLIAGATGQGKSVCINALITSLLFQVTPDRLRMLLIDPKRVELTGYNGLPHLALPVLVESHQAAAALRWAVAEMDRRYKLFSAEGVRNIAAYNDKAAAKLARQLPYIVIVIDELADLMMVAAGEIEELICRIAQLARAVGIHLIIATQRPSTDIITGLIKANIPSRVAFAVGSQVDSRVILDTGGAEKLLGRGDMLYQPVDAGKPTRIQGAFVSDPEVEGVVNFWKSQGEPRYMEEILEEGAGSAWEGERREERKLDPLFARSARAVAAEGAASVSLVQRKFNVGYSRAGRIVDQLAEDRVVGGYQGSKSREVLMTLPDVDELLERLGIE